MGLCPPLLGNLLIYKAITTRRHYIHTTGTANIRKVSATVNIFTPQNLNKAEQVGNHLAIDVIIYYTINILQAVTVAALSKVWVCGRSLAGTVGSNPTGGMNVCLL